VVIVVGLALVFSFNDEEWLHQKSARRAHPHFFSFRAKIINLKITKKLWPLLQILRKRKEEKGQKKEKF